MQYTSPMHTYLIQIFLEAPILVPKEYNLLHLKINRIRVRAIKNARYKGKARRVYCIDGKANRRLFLFFG